MASKRTTAADIAAAVALGAIPADAEVTTAAEAAEQAAAAAREAAANAAPIIPAALSGAHHECGIPGCRHGSHSGTPQPDRQLKLVTECDAVIRITSRALARAGGSLTDAHGHAFTIDATRRAYSRRTA